MKLFAAAVMLVAAAVSAVAADPAPAPKWDNSASLGVNLSRGNSQNLLAQGALRSEYKGLVHQARMGIEGTYGESEKTLQDGTRETQTDVENERAFAEYRRVLGKQNYAYVNGEILNDRIAAIDYRLLAGPGVGRDFIKTSAIQLGADVGVTYIYECDRQADGSKDRDSSFALRLSQRYDQKITGTSKIWESVEYLPAFEDFSDYLLNAELGAEAAMNAKLSLRFVAQDKYDSTPAQGRKRNDVLLTAGASYKF